MCPKAHLRFDIKTQPIYFEPSVVVMHDGRFLRRFSPAVWNKEKSASIEHLHTISAPTVSLKKMNVASYSAENRNYFARLA